MNVSPRKPFEIVYSIYAHEYLGFLFESFVVQKDDQGRLTYQHQNISAKNAKEFDAGLDEADYGLIALMDTMQPEVVGGHFCRKKIHYDDFLLATYDPEHGDKALQEQIHGYLERRRSKILAQIEGKRLFMMGNDGEPTWQEIEVLPDRATVLFHFRRNEENTHYFPTIKYGGHKLEYQYKGAFLICQEPANLVVENKLYRFQHHLDGNKLKPFLNKKFIAIPRQMEETYFRKFVVPLVEQHDVFAKGFDIRTLRLEPQPTLRFSELASGRTESLFEDQPSAKSKQEGHMLFELKFHYGDYAFSPNGTDRAVNVKLERQGEDYVFHRVERQAGQEQLLLDTLEQSGLPLRNGRATLAKGRAFDWLAQNRERLQQAGVRLAQDQAGSTKSYFLGESSLSVEVADGIDWFDLKAVVRFGDYEIPFMELRKLVKKNKHELTLPNGQTAVIPDSWKQDYAELFHFSEVDEESGKLVLRKHHVALVKELQEERLAEVKNGHDLGRLRQFEQLEEAPMPAHFKGELRPYQKAGYDWLRFLNDYRLGGCLADDMGLGKTVQTLALLQHQKEAGQENASLLVMPTSLIYNWQREARKFTPKLKTFVYTGTDRVKDVGQFQGYDLVLTTYGILRLDVELLSQYYFNYVILDESQVIKNPKSIISRSVRELRSRHRLILTGTPLENSTMDLWSQLSFVNPGLLGTKQYFAEKFQTPIEKHQDERRVKKLTTLIKPFILRRQKSQVAADLPPKVEKVHYAEMTPTQQQKYEEAKEFYRKTILDKIEQEGLRKSQMVLLQGLTQLRQLANHPALVDGQYEGDSGKMDDVLYMLESALTKGHKVLIFSQFVKHLTLLRKELDKLNVDYAYLDGTTKDRQAEVSRFQEQEDLQVFLISLKAGGLGLNLTQADYVFLLDPWWNPAVENQAIDRAHRIGQDKKVFTYKFITKNTVEEKILALQERKRALANELITTEESFMKKLTSGDIAGLLS